MVLTLAATLPVKAGPFSASIVSNAPLTIALGALAFGAVALLVLRRAAGDRRAERAEAARQVGDLRAEVDEYEALLSGAREITVLWTASGGAPRVFGQVSQLLPPGRRPEAILDFGKWLEVGSASGLAQAIEGLRVRGESFALDLKAQDGQAVRVAGSVIGGGAALRIRPSIVSSVVEARPKADDVLALLVGLSLPAYRRRDDGRIDYANAAYLALTAGRGKPEAPADLLDATMRPAAGTSKTLTIVMQVGRFDLTELPLSAGSVGYLRPQPTAPAAEPEKPRDGGTAAMVDALSVPTAIFDAGQRLVAFNRGYADLWRAGAWLKPGLDERAILDRLRRESQLPSEPDYQGWRAAHLAAYGLKTRRTEPWHLPDGRTLEVTAAPAGPDGGVIYLFEDMSQQLALVSQNRAQASVQRSTLNALSDAVAVFGTNGRLQLFNPRLSALWKLPTNFLEQNPHIDQIAAAIAIALPEDGAAIWRDLKRAVIDLTPTRTDTSGRLTRSDGRLIDYAVVRLPDGQKLMTFLDVTESAGYSRVLKERNDALVTADRLKDAFVQNVSYELRSPLTNIIGFADLLASPEIGPLNQRQRDYTDYIRASSVTLGVLIDNILDLATVDAGIAELRPEPQDIPALVEKARAGLVATFPQAGGGTSVNLKTVLETNLPPLIADGTRIVQVLYNLLSSAARFSEPGGEVRLNVSTRGDRVLFVVEDDGAMSDDARAELLDRAEVAGNTGRDRGAGLGLAIVRAFVNLHGGTITLEQRQPRGNRVVVNLPRDASAAATTAAE